MEKIDQQIEAFFGSEGDSPLSACLNELGTLPSEAHMSKAFCVFSAFDLLAQFYRGELKKGQSAKRLKKYWEKYTSLNNTQLELLYRFRNAVIHSFGQHAFDKRTKREFRFLIDNGQSQTITAKTKTVVCVNVEKLENQLVKAISAYREDLTDKKHLRENFNTVYRRIGVLFDSGPNGSSAEQ
jgi:predicted transcriptional regulator